MLCKRVEHFHPAKRVRILATVIVNTLVNMLFRRRGREKAWLPTHRLNFWAVARRQLITTGPPDSQVTAVTAQDLTPSDSEFPLYQKSHAVETPGYYLCPGLHSVPGTRSDHTDRLPSARGTGSLSPPWRRRNNDLISNTIQRSQHSSCFHPSSGYSSCSNNRNNRLPQAWSNPVGFQVKEIR